jgi:hypothetical protein
MPAPLTNDYEPKRKEILIEKNVPKIPRVPPNRVHYPFERMEVGDSFEINRAKYKNMNTLQASLRTSANKFCKRKGLDWKFATSQTSKNSVRIWRVK